MKARTWMIGVLVVAAASIVAWGSWYSAGPAQTSATKNKSASNVWSPMIGKKCDVLLVKDARGVRFDDCILLAADAHWIRVQRMKKYVFVFPRENIASVTFHPTP